MKALTICQPYAELIARGLKPVENRTWSTNYRGPLAIHAGKSRDWMLGEDLAALGVKSSDLVFGAFVAVATLAHCVRVEEVHKLANGAWLSNHVHTNGPWCLVLEDVRRLPKPVPYRGAQGLFDVDDAVLAG